MIESPARSMQDSQNALQLSRISLKGMGIPRVSRDDRIPQKTTSLLQGSSIASYYMRLSWKNKLNLMSGLIKEIHSLATIRILLNALYAVGGEIASYCLVSPLAATAFDKILDDHDRMLDEKTISESVNGDLRWFSELDDQDQMAYLLTLLRNSGGAMMRLFYKLLEDSYRQRLCHFQSQAVSKTEAERNKVEKSPDIFSYDRENPKHQKVLRLQKQWQETMVKHQKHIAKQKTPKQTNQGEKKGKKHKKVKKSKSDGRNKKGNKVQDYELDWIQLMPIGTVKKIFGYLNRKTLMKAKKVNAYWNWAIAELIKDQKVRKLLDKAHRKLKESCGGDCALPPEAVPKPPRVTPSRTEKRLKKLEHRGAILPCLRLTHLEAEEMSSVLVVALKREFDEEFGKNLTMFPRVARSNPPLYKRPDFVVKDLNIICETADDVSEEGTDATGYTGFSSVPSIDSVEFLNKTHNG